MALIRQIPLSDIEEIDEADLIEKRIRMLENGFSPFEYVLKNSKDPIRLCFRGGKYEIIDGRHRIHIARKRGYVFVPASVG